MQAELDRLLASQEFDLVQVESVQMMGLRVNGICPVVLDEHNVESELLRQVARTESSTSRRVFAAIEAAKLRREELRSWASVDGCVLTSSVDEATVRSLAPKVATRVVPNGVDLEAFRPLPGDVDSDSIVFVGAINYRPNTDAVLFFAREVLPRIHQVRPSAVFTVVGGGVPRVVARLAADHVRLAGPVTDIRPHLAGAGVVVAPLRAGGGTRLKVLEALAMGKAVVSTSVGCEGLAVRNLEHLLIADEPEEFAEGVLRLMADPDLRSRLGRAGRTLVQREYGWDHALECLEQFHAELTGDPVGTRR
jgi:glycosyltransferase involved in cell wall biosynthesis